MWDKDLETESEGTKEQTSVFYLPFSFYCGKIYKRKKFCHFKGQFSSINHIHNAVQP